jgi:beta-phosphoglucomutase-like phosphatase (HAD superfamily)
MEIDKILEKISNYDLILFDFDGTLFETKTFHEKAYEIADINKSKNRYESKCQAFLELVSKSKIEIKEISLLIYFYVSFHKKKKAIVSATLLENVNLILSKSQINFTFDKIYCGGNLGEKNKPNPFMHIDAMNHFNVCSKKTIILEDSEKGFIAAQKANIDCFNVNTMGFYYNHIEE